MMFICTRHLDGRRHDLAGLVGKRHRLSPSKRQPIGAAFSPRRTLVPLQRLLGNTFVQGDVVRIVGSGSVPTAIGGGLLLGVSLPLRAEIRDTLATDAPYAPNAFLRIDRAGKVTFVMPMIEMGQGTYTSLPMLIAEELEVDVDKVTIEHSPADDKLYVNPIHR